MSAQPDAVPPALPPGLTERDVAILDFERAWGERRGSKDAAIRAQFGVTTPRYYQMLYSLIDSPSALRHDPLLVRRLQRIRESRTRARSVRSFRTEHPDRPHTDHLPVERHPGIRPQRDHHHEDPTA